MTDAPYSRETVAAPPEIMAELQRLAALPAGGPGRAALGGLVSLAFVMAAVFGIIALIDLLFGVIEAAHWFVLVLGSAIIVLPMILIHLRTARQDAPAREALAARLRDDAAAGQVLRHTLLRDERHCFVEHEHGAIHLCPAGEARTLYLDLSSVSDDARHDRWFAKGLIDRTRWTWFTTTDGAALLGFEAAGDPLPRRSLEAESGRYDPEIGAALFRYLGSPDDGALIDKPFARVEAWIRRRLAKPAPA